MWCFGPFGIQFSGWKRIGFAWNRIRISHFLPHFNLNTNTDMDFFKYEYKTDVSNLDFYLDIYSIELKVYTVKFNIYE